MVVNVQPNANSVLNQFEFRGKFASIAPYGSGHINDTYCATFLDAGRPRRFILQRINSGIFKNPVAVMKNIQRTTSHLAAQILGEPDSERRVLRLISARDGECWHIDPHGHYWRAYQFVENSRTYDAVESADQAFQAAKAFGSFQRHLVNLPAPRLCDTIPDFHHTPRRFAAMESTISSDVVNRAVLARAEIDFALARHAIVSVLLDANLPERVTHNDTKLNNVLLDSTTGEAVCVIDLDTVMPGLAPFDFGDMVRTTTSPAKEDEQDLSRIVMQYSMFEALVRGYFEGAGSFLTKQEKDHLVFAGKLITFEQGLRFLTDYLAGDSYYKTHRDGQNLDRCRTQFKLVESIEEQEERMERLVRSIG
jgi:hypothetical protein